MVKYSLGLRVYDENMTKGTNHAKVKFLSEAYIFHMAVFY